MLSVSDFGKNVGVKQVIDLIELLNLGLGILELQSLHDLFPSGDELRENRIGISLDESFKHCEHLRVEA